MINKQEEASALLDVVASNLVSVEERLVAVESHKNAVRENFEIVKEHISEVVERQLSNLKSKERQLLRQVELANTHQNCELVFKQAQLSSHKGALSKSRTFLDTCSDQWAGMDSNTKNSIASSMGSASDQDLASLLDKTDKLIAAPIVSVSLNETDLETCIKNLGTVSLPCSLPSHDFLPHSACEEYGDMDHHVLYKSLQPDTPRPIDVRKPYLLAVKNKKTAIKNTKSEDCKKEELYKWLHHLQLDNYGDMEQECCQGAVPCIEEACQANEACASFADCLMGGQCKKSAQEKIDQSRNWIQKQIKSAESEKISEAEKSPICSVLKHMDAIMNGENAVNCEVPSDSLCNMLEKSNLNVTPMKFAVSEKRSSSEAENSPINSVLSHMDAIMSGENCIYKDASDTACKRMKRSDSNLNLTPIKSAVSEKRSNSDAPINSVLNHLDAIMNGGNDKWLNCKGSVYNVIEKSHGNLNLTSMKSVVSEKQSSSSATNSPINSILSQMDAIMNGENHKSCNRKDSSGIIYKSHSNLNSTPVNVSEKSSSSDAKNSPINSMLSHMDAIMNGENHKLNRNDSSEKNQSNSAPIFSRLDAENSLIMNPLDSIMNGENHKLLNHRDANAAIFKRMSDHHATRLNSAVATEKPSISESKNAPINSVLNHLDAIMNGENDKFLSRKNSIDMALKFMEKRHSNSNLSFEDVLKMEKEKMSTLSNSAPLLNKCTNKMISDKEEMMNNFLNKVPLERTKSQMSMCSFPDDLENVKERMEKITFDNYDNKKWLLDMDNKMTENKITEEVTKSKEDCNSSVSNYSTTSSFEVLSNPDSIASYNSWLLPQ